MDETIENIDSTNDDTTEEVAQTTEEAEKEEPTFTDAERKAFARAKVAEAKVKELKAQLEGTSKKAEKSDGLDYGQKAYLVANGIKASTEVKLVQEWMKESGKDLETVLESKRFQGELEDMRAIAKTAIATPTGKRSGNSPLESVEYWMTKPFEEVPKDMKYKVVAAQLDKDKNKGKFYNS